MFYAMEHSEDRQQQPTHERREKDEVENGHWPKDVFEIEPTLAALTNPDIS